MPVSISGNLTRLFLKKETNYGSDPSAWNNSTKLHYTGMTANYDKNFIDDNNNLGIPFLYDKIEAGIKADGNFNFSAHPEEFGHLLFHAFGSNAQYFPPIARILIVYTGTAESCVLAKIVNNLTARSGTLNAETYDSNFNGGGLIDLTTVSDLSTLISLINSFTGYKAYMVYGSSSESPVDLQSFADVQIKKVPYMPYIPDTSSLLSENIFEIGTDQKSYSLLIDKVIEKNIILGCKTTGLNLQFEPRQILKGSVNFVAQNVSDVSATITATEEKTRAFVTNNMKIFIDGVLSEDVKKLTIDYQNTMSGDEQILGSELIAEPYVRMAGMTIDAELRYNSNTLTQLSKYKNGDAVSLLIYIEGYDEVETDKKYYVIFHILKTKIVSANSNPAGNDTLTLPLSFAVVYPFDDKYTTWLNKPIRVYQTTKISLY